MNVKARNAKKQVNVENQAINLWSKEELNKKIEVVEKKLRSYTWRELETNDKFAKNDKLSFITDDMLIVGCDIGSETHYISEIVSYAEKRVGLTDGTDVGREAVKWYAEQILKLDEQLASVESTLHRKCREIPYAENILESNGVGENILSGILAEMGDISRFDDVKEIQKLSGMGLVACSSGKHKGQTKISHRGRKRLRYWLFQAAKSAVSHADEFKQMHEYYTTRSNNPLKKMQSLVVIACKILRVIYTILKTGTTYDPQKLLKDIKHPAASQAPMAA